MNHITHITFLLLLLAFFFATTTNAYVITVTPRSQECFSEELQPKERMLVTYEVVSGGMLDINIRAQGPDAKLVYEQEREKGGSFQFFALEAGLYQVCFSNAMSTMTSKMISFNIYAGHELHRFNNAKADHIQPLDKAVMSLTENARKLSDSYHYIRTRLLTCHSTTESSYERAFFWGGVNIFVAIVGILLRTIAIVKPFEGKAPMPSRPMGHMSTTSIAPQPVGLSGMMQSLGSPMNTFDHSRGSSATGFGAHTAPNPFGQPSAPVQPSFAPQPAFNNPTFGAPQPGGFNNASSGGSFNPPPFSQPPGGGNTFPAFNPGGWKPQGAGARI